MSYLKETLESLHLLDFLIVLCLGLFTVFSALVWFCRKGKRIFSNMKRPILMICTDDTSFSNFRSVRNYLIECDIFNIKDEVSNADCIEHIDNHALIILAYDKNMQHWNKIFHHASISRIPVIVYTFQKHLSVDEFNKIDEIAKNYSFLTFANNKVSLTNTVFTTLSTHKLKKHG